MKNLLLLFTLFMTFVTRMSAQAVGTWTYYPCYADITAVVKASNNILYAVASGNLFAYNPSDGSITEYDKTNTLNDNSIKAIAWCQTTSKLIIVYDNSNIDLMTNSGEVQNISDLYSKSMTADKTVNDIYLNGSDAYLSTGFGIIKVNVQGAYIADTYNLGFNVDHSYIESGSIYASSPSEGLYSASLTSNLVDKSVWSRVGEYVSKERTIDATLLETVTRYVPNGPSTSQFFATTFQNGSLYAVPGNYVAGEIDAMTPGEVNSMSAQGVWSSYENNLSSITGYDYLNVQCVAVDPSDANHVFVGGRCGLYEFYEGKLQKAYNQQNSPLRGIQYSSTQMLGNDYTIINGITFDKTGNLWILNSFAQGENIIELKSDGTFVEHFQQDLVYNGLGPANLTNAFFDSRGLLWFVNNHYNNSLFACYNPSTDELNVYESPFINEDGSTVSAQVRTLTEDGDGNIWIGTSKGPLVLTVSMMNSNSKILRQPKVPRNDGTNYADYLLNEVDISALSVDGGGRIWIGTKSLGIYLIDSDGITQLQHFTQSDSPLISDDVTSISIDGSSGRVFIASMNGLCSYMSDSTSPSDEMTKENVWAYPNPVTPDYTGRVTIVGLTKDADVKILTSSGVVVAEGTSSGGSFTWDCNDKSGRRVASGVYFVATATAEGKRGTVCKIAVVN